MVKSQGRVTQAPIVQKWYYTSKSFNSISSKVTMAHSGSLIQFSGHQYLRNRLVLSILSGKPVRVDKIRSEDKNPGLRGELLSVGSALEKG